MAISGMQITFSFLHSALSVCSIRSGYWRLNGYPHFVGSHTEEGHRFEANPVANISHPGVASSALCSPQVDPL